jgi:two-component sensor histidine kinase
MARHAVGKLDYVDCVVYMLDEEENHFYQAAAHGPKNPIYFDINNPIIIKHGEGIVGSVAASGKGEIVNDTRKDDRYLLDDENRLSEITIPIIANGKVIGIVDSEHPEANYYSQDDLDMLNTIASMSSVKLEEVKIQQELLEHKSMLENIVLEKTRELQLTVLELQESNTEISNQNKEKEVLIKEIHHRVKNNLQILSSLMNLQSASSNSESEKEVFQDCRNRIISMSTIHDHLYTGGRMTEINAKRYMEEVLDDLLRAFGALNRVKLEAQVEELHFDIDTSIPLGLVFNEIIVNSLKHGIKNNEGTLGVYLSKNKEIVTLQIHDSGDGFDFKEDHNSLGMELIDTLTSQLDGEISYQCDDKGTTCTLTFPSAN